MHECCPSLCYVCRDFKCLVSSYTYVFTFMSVYDYGCVRNHGSQSSTPQPHLANRGPAPQHHSHTASTADSRRTLRLSISYPAITRFTTLSFSFPSPARVPGTMAIDLRPATSPVAPPSCPDSYADSQCPYSRTLEKHRRLVMPSPSMTPPSHDMLMDML